MMKTPEFWSHRGPAALALLPLTPLWWGAATLRRIFATAYRAPVPVICIGNLTAGGVGKTPLVAWLHDRLAERGLKPAILSGYAERDRRSVDRSSMMSASAAMNR